MKEQIFKPKLGQKWQKIGKNKKVKDFRAKKSLIPKGITEKIDFRSRNRSENGKKLKKKGKNWAKKEDFELKGQKTKILKHKWSF